MTALGLVLAGSANAQSTGAPAPEPEVQKTAEAPAEATETDEMSSTDDADTEQMPAIEPLGSGTLRGVSWSVLGGRIPESGGIIHGEMGFPGIPRLSYHHAVGHDLMLGAVTAFSYANTRVGEAFNPSFMLGASARYGMVLTDELDLGIRALLGFRAPGVGAHVPFGFGSQIATASAGLLLEVEANVAWLVMNRLTVGGGASLPIEISFGNGATGLNFPILVGGIVEYHVIPPLALTFDFKMGPHFSSATSPVINTVEFGLRALLGVAYRI